MMPHCDSPDIIDTGFWVLHKNTLYKNEYGKLNWETAVKDNIVY